jgi:long-chain fatty acid transport protein
MAALADDASTVFFNPAGMTRFSRPQLVNGATFADIRTQFDGTFHNFPIIESGVGLFSYLIPTYAYSQFVGGGLGEVSIWTTELLPSLGNVPVPYIDGATFKVPRAKGDSHPIAPFFHFVTPLYCSYDWTFSAGISVCAPFGLESDYTGTYVQSYCADNKFEQISINPSLAVRYKKLSIGGGFDYMFLKDIYTIGTASSGASINLANVDPTLHRLDFSSKSRLWTWNIGALYEYNSSFRIGATYRARSDLRQKGDANVLGNKGKARSVFHLPDYLNIGCYLDIQANLGLMFDFGVTFWSRFKNVTIKTTVPSNFISFLGDGDIIIKNQQYVVPFHFKNSYFVALGAKYTVYDDLLFKFGISVETTPTTDKYRELRIPDNTRYGIATGIHYAINTHLGLDVAYEFLFLPKAHVGKNPLINTDFDVTATISGVTSTATIPEGGAQFNGSVKTQGQLFSMQLSWTF